MTKNNIAKIGKTQKKVTEPDIITPILQDEVPMLLQCLLSLPTPHGSEGRLLGFMPKGYKMYSSNLVYDVGVKGIAPTTIFSSHMDTVHPPFWKDRKIKLGKNEAGFVIAYVEDDKSDGFRKSVLGADDKVGMYIMLEMMKAKVPGRYIFHVGEEAGGIGSGDIIKNHPALYEAIDRCIAFDRMGYSDVIRYQRSKRCCSDAFATDLAKRLNDLIPKKDIPTSTEFSSASGSYTDSAEYMDAVPECTNISVGYFSQHTSNERFDCNYLVDTLIPALILLDWEALPVVRDPSRSEAEYFYGGGYGGGSSYSGGVDRYPYGSVEYKLQNITTQHQAQIDFDDLINSKILPVAATTICIKRHLVRNDFNTTATDIFELIEDYREALETIDKLKEDQASLDAYYFGNGYGGIN